MKSKQVKAQYTMASKAGQVAATLGMPHQTLENWLRVDKVGKLTGIDGKVVMPEQMELTRLRGLRMHGLKRNAIY